MKKAIIEKENQVNKYELFRCIKNYSEATYALAKKMDEIKTKMGRKTIEDITLFDLSRINSLCRIGRCNISNFENLLPEHACELSGETEICQKNYQKQILQRGIKPSELRRLIRNNSKNKDIASKENKVKVSKWNQHLILLGNELKNMDSSTKARALGFITNEILNLQ